MSLAANSLTAADFQPDTHDDLVCCVAYDSSAASGSHSIESSRLSTTDFFSMKKNEDIGSLGTSVKVALAWMSLSPKIVPEERSFTTFIRSLVILCRASISRTRRPSSSVLLTSQYGNLATRVTHGNKSSQRLYFTTDASRYWHAMKTPSPPNPFGVQVLRFQPRTDYLIWIGSVDCQPGYENCRAQAQYTWNNGRNWQLVEDYVVDCDWARDEELRIDSLYRIFVNRLG